MSITPKELLPSELGNFSFEYSIFQAIPWHTDPVVKYMSFLRCINVVQTSKDAVSMIIITSSDNYRKYIHPLTTNRMAIQILFIDTLLKLRLSGNVQDVDDWATILGYFHKYYFETNNVEYQTKYNQLKNNIAPLVSKTHEESNQFSLNKSLLFLQYGIREAIITSFLKKIFKHSDDLRTTWENSKWIKGQLTPHFIQGEKKTLAEPAYQLCEELIKKELQRPNLSLTDFKYLQELANTTESIRPISKECVAVINESIQKFVKEKTSLNTPFEELANVFNTLGFFKSFEYQECAIESYKTLDPLQKDLATYNDTAYKEPLYSKLSFLNLLKQEAIIRKEMEDETSIEKLKKLHDKIPSVLGYLRADLMKKVQVLLEKNK